MPDELLFPHVPKPVPRSSGGTSRLRRAVRNQVEFLQADLDSLLVEEHPARCVWAFVEGAELAEFYTSIPAWQFAVGLARRISLPAVVLVCR